MGYLYKTGAKSKDGWRKRFVYLDINRLLYFTHPLDAVAVNEVRLRLDQLDVRQRAISVSEGNNSE